MLAPVDKNNDFDQAQVVDQLPPPAKQYQVQPGDFLLFRIFTNNGESILDPNGELRFGTPAGKGSVGLTLPAAAAGSASAPVASAGATNNEGSSFEVLPDGQVRLPMVGFVPVAGLRLLQIDSLLEKRFSAFYKDVFVESRIANQRVVVLGAPGRGPQVVPLTYQTTSLLEVLALAGGVPLGSRATNIRLIRGADTRTAQVQIVDLSTIEGMRKANAQVIANDVVYIEPVRRPFLSGAADSFRVIGILTGLATVVALLARIN